MKAVLIILLLVIVLAGAGYVALPVVIEKQTSGLASEIQEVKQRLQKAEEFIRGEDEARKATQLLPDADAQKIIKAVNALSSRVQSVENLLGTGLAKADESIKKQKESTEEALQKQAEAIEKLNNDIQARLQKIDLQAAIANVRGHIAKARTDLLSKNIANAKTELELVGSIFETLKNRVSGENKKSIEDLEATLKTVRSEIDTDPPAAINRVDLLWYEMSKLLRKG